MLHAAKRRSPFCPPARQGSAAARRRRAVAATVVRAGAAILAAATLALPIALAPAPAAAQESGGDQAAALDGAVTWGVAPSSKHGPNGRPAFEYKLDPGATLTDYVGVSNFSDRALTVAVYASDAFNTRQGGFDLLPAGSEPTDVGSWIALAKAKLTIPARSRVDVPFEITVPGNATPGDHAGGIVASLTTEAAGERGQVAVDRRVGARIYLRVTGPLRPALEIERLDARYHGSLNPLAAGRVAAAYSVRNTGNVRLTARPALHTAGPFRLGARNVTAGGLPEILPGQSYAAAIETSGMLPLVRLRAALEVVPAGTGSTVLDPAPAVARREAALWAPPWPQAAVLLLAGAVAAGWVRLRQARRRRADAVLARAVAAARDQGRAEGVAAVGVAAGAGQANPPGRSRPGRDNQERRP